MKAYEINGWRLEFPGHWRTERDPEDGHWLFYPPDSPLTVHVSPFHLEKAGVLAPAEAAGQVFRASLAAQGGQGAAVYSSWTGPLPAGFFARVFEDTVSEGGQSICRLCLGVYGPGELLSVNIYGQTGEECREALDCFKTLDRV